MFRHCSAISCGVAIGLALLAASDGTAIAAPNQDIAGDAHLCAASPDAAESDSGPGAPSGRLATQATARNASHGDSSSLGHPHGSNQDVDSDALSMGLAGILAPDLTFMGDRHLEHSEARCYTPEIQSLVKRKGSISPWLSDRLDALLLGEDAGSASRYELGRPFATGSVASQRYPITVHYRTRANEGRARQVLELAEQSWSKELAMGFAPAVGDDGKGGDDNLDVYLTSELRSGGGAYTSLTYDDPNPIDGIRTCAAFIAIYEGLDMVDEMPVFVAHELNHAFQAAMDYTEHPFFWEATAVAIEDLVFDEVNDYYGFIDDFQERPHSSINNTSGIFPYGGVVFTQFIDHMLGDDDGSALAEIWRRSGQEDEINEPDYLDIIDDLSNEHGLDGLDELFMQFSGWRYFANDLDDGTHFEEASGWPSDGRVLITRALELNELPVSGLAPEYGVGLEPADLAANYYTVQTSAAPNATIRLKLSGATSTRWALTVVRWYSGSPGQVLTLGIAPNSGQLTKDVPVQGADHVAIAVINMGGATFDAEDYGNAELYTLALEMR